jgi:hypothetical protein
MFLQVLYNVYRTSANKLNQKAHMSSIHESIPNSEICQKATQLVAEVSPTFLCHHCIRTFLFGDLLGQRDELKCDRELLYLGAVMGHQLKPGHLGKVGVRSQNSETSNSLDSWLLNSEFLLSISVLP